MSNFIHAAAQHIAHFPHTELVGNEIRTEVHVETDGFASREGILVGGEELEIPAVNFLLVFDAGLDVLCRELFARVLHAVRDDHAQDVLGTFGFGHVGEFMADCVDGGADGIVQRGAAGTDILRHEIIMELREIGGPDDALRLIAELIEVEHCLAGFLTLFLQKFVEAAFDVVLDRSHGPGGIEDDEDVGIFFFHIQFLLAGWVWCFSIMSVLSWK